MKKTKTIVEKYIKFCAQSKEQINRNVGNDHLGVRFSEVVEFIDYYKSGDHKTLFEKYDFPASVAEVFPDVEMSIETVHEAYQRLRAKDNPLRNYMILLIIEDSSENKIMQKRVKRGSFDIYKKYQKKYG